MKKKTLHSALLLFISLLPALLFSSCDKDTNCYLKVTVLNERRAPIANATVTIRQTTGDALNERAGVTNGEGVFTTYFTAPAILTIEAAQDVYQEGVKVGEYQGKGTARVSPGEEVESIVVLSSEVTYL